MTPKMNDRQQEELRPDMAKDEEAIVLPPSNANHTDRSQEEFAASLPFGPTTSSAPMNIPSVAVAAGQDVEKESGDDMGTFGRSAGSTLSRSLSSKLIADRSQSNISGGIESSARRSSESERTFLPISTQESRSPQLSESVKGKQRAIIERLQRPITVPGSSSWTKSGTTWADSRSQEPEHRTPLSPRLLPHLSRKSSQSHHPYAQSARDAPPPKSADSIRHSSTQGIERDAVLEAKGSIRNPSSSAEALPTSAATAWRYRQYERFLEQQPQQELGMGAKRSRPTSLPVFGAASASTPGAVSESGEVNHPSGKTLHPSPSPRDLSTDTEHANSTPRFGRTSLSGNGTRDRVHSDPAASGSKVKAQPRPFAFPGRRSVEISLRANRRAPAAADRHTRAVSAAEAGAAAVAVASVEPLFAQKTPHISSAAASAPRRTTTPLTKHRSSPIAQRRRGSTARPASRSFGDSDGRVGRVSHDDFEVKPNRPSMSSMFTTQNRALYRYHFNALSALRARLPARPSVALKPLRYPSLVAKVHYTFTAIETFAHVAVTLYLDYVALYTLAQIAAYPGADNASAAWWVALGVYAASTASWFFTIVLIHETYFEYFRRWQRREWDMYGGVFAPFCSYDSQC